MKRTFFAVFLFGIFCFIPFQSFGACDCTEVEIIEKLKNASSYELGGLFEKLADSASFFSSVSTRHAFAEVIYSLKDEYSFQEALRGYIENNCRVQGEHIVCQ